MALNGIDLIVAHSNACFCEAPPDLSAVAELKAASVEWDFQKYFADRVVDPEAMFVTDEVYL